MAGALRCLDYDLVIGGRQAIDGDTAQVGPEMAEHLGLPQISYVTGLEYDGNKTLTVKKETEEGYQMLSVEMPCVLTVLATANKARYMTVSGIMDAFDKEVEIWTASKIDIEPEKLGLKGSPTRVKKSFTKAQKGAGETFEVDPEEGVNIIINKLKEKHII